MLTPEEKRRIIETVGCAYCRVLPGTRCFTGSLRFAHRLHGSRLSAAVRLGLITRNVQVAEMRRRGH